MHIHAVLLHRVMNFLVMAEVASEAISLHIIPMLLFVDENGQINMETEGIVEIITVEIMAFIVHGEPILV